MKKYTATDEIVDHKGDLIKIEQSFSVDNAIINSLIIKKRIFFVDQIAEKFLNIISIKKGELSLNIVSAKKLEDKEILDLEKEISSNLKNKIKLNCKTDPSLIGGLVLQIGSLMIDTSLKNKLNKYKKSMMEN